jgi:hypothetical protein
MGIRVRFTLDDVKHVFKIDQFFYWPYMDYMDNSKKNKNTNIWLEYMEETKDTYNADIINLMTSNWDNITDFCIY